MNVLVDALNGEQQVIAAELRPPRAELQTSASMDAWIDTYHAVRGLTRDGTFVFLTDSAVGMKEEDNLRHLIINLGTDVPRSRVGPKLVANFCADLTPKEEFEKARVSPIQQLLAREKGSGRPTKRERRLLDRFLE